jgi:hypothetical protein
MAHPRLGAHSGRLAVFPLHSQLSIEEQEEALRPLQPPEDGGPGNEVTWLLHTPECGQLGCSQKAWHMPGKCHSLRLQCMGSSDDTIKTRCVSS